MKTLGLIGGMRWGTAVTQLFDTAAIYAEAAADRALA
jgi:hypothetical protein